MADAVTVDTGPLIALERMNALNLPRDLPFQFFCPDEVKHEIYRGRKLGYPDIHPEWLNVTSLKTPLSTLVTSSLDKGEAAVIQLALDMETEWVCIDEWKGRRVALASRLKVVGSLGLLAKAKQLGIIHTIGPYIEKAQNQGIRYDTRLTNRILEHVGEL